MASFVRSDPSNDVLLFFSVFQASYGDDIIAIARNLCGNLNEEIKRIARI